MTRLHRLIAESVALAGGDLCSIGHEWTSVGGRACPRGSEQCSQAVYRCTRCGEYDYGEPGGPGHDDCEGCVCARMDVEP